MLTLCRVQKNYLLEGKNYSVIGKGCLVEVSCGSKLRKLIGVKSTKALKPMAKVCTCFKEQCIATETELKGLEFISLYHHVYESVSFFF